MKRSKSSKNTLQVRRAARATQTGLRNYTRIEPSKINKADRTIEIALSSEFPVNRGWYTEILSHEKEHVDLSRMNNGHPFLLNHNADDQIGVVEKTWIDSDRKARCIVRFGTSARAEEIFQDVQNGIRPHISVGYEHTEEVSSERNKDGEEVVRFAWRPYEASSVPIPADPSVGVGREKPSSKRGPGDEYVCPACGEKSLESMWENDKSGEDGISCPYCEKVSDENVVIAYTNENEEDASGEHSQTANLIKMRGLLLRQLHRIRTGHVCSKSCRANHVAEYKQLKRLEILANREDPETFTGTYKCTGCGADMAAGTEPDSAKPGDFKLLCPSCAGKKLIKSLGERCEKCNEPLNGNTRCPQCGCGQTVAQGLQGKSKRKKYFAQCDNCGHDIELGEDDEQPQSCPNCESEGGFTNHSEDDSYEGEPGRSGAKPASALSIATGGRKKSSSSGEYYCDSCTETYTPSMGIEKKQCPKCGSEDVFPVEDLNFEKSALSIATGKVPASRANLTSLGGSPIKCEDCGYVVQEDDNIDEDENAMGKCPKCGSTDLNWDDGTFGKGKSQTMERTARCLSCDKLNFENDASCSYCGGAMHGKTATEQ